MPWRKAGSIETWSKLPAGYQLSSVSSASERVTLNPPFLRLALICTSPLGVCAKEENDVTRSSAS